MAGIELVDVTNPDCKKCKCVKQHEWDTDKEYSRDNLIQLLTRAERIFTEAAKLHASPTQILGEKHKYKYGNRGLTTKDGNLKTVLPNFACQDVQMGVGKLNEIEVIAGDTIATQIAAWKALYVNDDPSTLPQYVDLEIDIQQITPTDGDYVRDFANIESNLVVLFKDSDLRRKKKYNTDGTVEDVLLSDMSNYQVRPIQIRDIVESVGTQNSGVVTFRIPSYLLRIPDDNDNNECCLHSPSCYVDDVDVFEIYVDKCEVGYFVCRDSKCNSEPCERTQITICGADDKIGCGTGFSPEPATCTYDATTDTYTIERIDCTGCIPEEVHINYVTGVPLNCGLVDDFVADTIFKLAIGLDPCHQTWCVCDKCAVNKWNNYVSYPLAKIGVGKQSGDYDSDYQLILTKHAINIAQGYKPNNGIVEAFREINDWHRCCPVEGIFI
jgi:hypothetical protein